jgi:hypothetical protein
MLYVETNIMWTYLDHISRLYIASLGVLRSLCKKKTWIPTRAFDVLTANSIFCGVGDDKFWRHLMIKKNFVSNY